MRTGTIQCVYIKKTLTHRTNLKLSKGLLASCPTPWNIHPIRRAEKMWCITCSQSPPWGNKVKCLNKLHNLIKMFTHLIYFLYLSFHLFLNHILDFELIILYAFVFGASFGTIVVEIASKMGLQSSDLRSWVRLDHLG